MTYTINKTDGSLLTEIIDSGIDTTATDLTLIGKNVTGYGEFINENFVKLLENFASVSSPNNPIVGQIWFDLSENRLKVYDGRGFKIGSGPIVQGTAPINPVQGELWIDSNENQLYFYDGTDRQLAGPIWKDSQGYSGFRISTVNDVSGNARVITELWSGAILLGIFSSHVEFTPSVARPGYSGSIKPGFNPANIDNFKLHTTTVRAEALVDSQGNLKTAENFMVTNGDNNTTGSLRIINPNPLKLGVSQETEIVVSPSSFQIRSNQEGQDLRLITRTGGFWNDAVTVKANNSRVGIFNPAPAVMLHIGTSTAPGNVIIEGNLTVNGATTTINSANLVIEDKLIELAKTSSPSDAFADGGGIALKGTTDHTLIWQRTSRLASEIIVGNRYVINTVGVTNFTSLGAASNVEGISFIATSTVPSTLGQGTVFENTWKSSENFELTQGHSYKINGVDVITETTLASSITSAPGLTSIGTLNSIQVDDIVIDNNVISSTAGSNIVLSPDLEEIIVNGRITGLTDPVNPQDAATRNFVESRLVASWQIIDEDYVATSNERLLIDTSIEELFVALPQDPEIGDLIRFIDFKNTFNTNNLTILRSRKLVGFIGTSANVSTPATYTSIAPIFESGPGPIPRTGLTVSVTLNQSDDSYTTANTAIVLTEPGTGYQAGDVLRIMGSSIGGLDGSNDLVFTLEIEPIFGTQDDLLITSQSAAFGLIFLGGGQGWRFSEISEIPVEIFSNVIGNVTGNVLSQNNNGVVLNTANPVALYTGNVTGNVTGNLTGSVQGNLTGTVLTASQTNITSVGTLSNLTVLGTINGNVTGTVTGNLVGNVLGSVTGPSGLTLQSTNSAINIISANSGLRLSAFSDTGNQEQYAMQVTPGSAVGNRSSTILFGDVIVANQTSSNTNGSSFRLPQYTTVQRDARLMSFLNHGELIYNLDDNVIQAYADGAWVDLH